MKALLCAVAFVFLANYCFGQKVPTIYQIRADTVRIYNTCDTAEFVLENRTKDTLGFLFNKGKGRTEFRRLGLQRIGASQLAIKGQDTVDLNFSSYGDTRYDLLSTNFYTITPGDSMTFFQWPARKVIGYDAYNSPDMPVLSNQAIQSRGSRLYYNGLVVSDGSSGFDLAVNWDGELNGPNGAFLRTRDDTKTAWSNWRELLFKDYADTAYAPRNASGSYIQNLSSGTQTANYSINGTGTAAYFTSTNGTGSNMPHLRLQTGALNRWVFSFEGAESTGNGGSDLSIGRYNDAGAYIESAFWLKRSTGNIGLGITAPTERLHVNGSILSQVAGANSSIVARSTSTGDAILTTDVQGISASSIRTFRTGGRTGIINNSIEAISILIGGDVGIGTATPAAKLDVRDTSSVANTTESILARSIGDVNFRLEARKGANANTTGLVAGKFGLTYNGTENAMINFHRGANSTGGFMSFSTNSGTERMRIDGAGFVGIGTTTPLAKLTVSGNTTSELFVMNTGAFATNSGAFARFYNAGTPSAANQVIGGIIMGSNPSAGVYRTAAQIQAISDTAWTDGTSHPSNLAFYTVPRSGVSPVEIMRITGNGYVGINKSSPTESLDVMGNGKFSGGIAAGYFNSGSSSGQVSFIGGNLLDYRGAQLDLYAGNNTTNTGMMLFRTGTGAGSSPQPERMRITGTGNLLVGTTVDGGQKLQVFGTTSTQKVIVTTPTAYDITHNNQSVAKDATTNELVPYDGNVADYLTLSTSTTLSTAEYYIKSNSTAYTVTVPSAAANPGRVYVIKNSGGTTNDITLNVTTNAQTIDGVGTNIAITPGAWIRIVSNGTAWFKVGG